MTTTKDPYWRLRPLPVTPKDEICACVAKTPILLQPHLSSNPLSCARCNLEVPPERIGFDEKVADEIAYWQRFYNCFYYLWLDSGDFEQWAMRHLCDSASAVNSRGIELADTINTYRRCYLSWFQDESSDGFITPTKCPRCQETLDVRFKDERPQGGSLLVCEKCSIALSF